MTKKQTKRIVKIALIIASVCSLWLVPWVLVKAWITPLPDTVQEQVDEAIEQGFAGLVVYVDQAGKPPAFYTGGWHNRENKIPAKPNALFKIGSNNKLYTAVAIAKLVKSNRLSLDKTLSDYFPELANRIEYADKITVRMLVQHRSGIPNYTDSPNYWANPPENYKENLQLILDLPADFEPNAEYAYSNTNYLLLSELIQKVVGYPKFQFIKEEILQPLNLNNTFGSLTEVNIEDVMSGYHVGHPYDLKTDKQGMVATAADLGAFLRALNDGSVFDAGEQEIYTSIYKYKHAGWVPGYQSFSEYHKDIDAVVITFYSTTDPDLILWNLSEIINTRIVKILREESN